MAKNLPSHSPPLFPLGFPVSNIGWNSPLPLTLFALYLFNFNQAYTCWGIRHNLLPSVLVSGLAVTVCVHLYKVHSGYPLICRGKQESALSRCSTLGETHVRQRRNIQGHEEKQTQKGGGDVMVEKEQTEDPM